MQDFKLRAIEMVLLITPSERWCLCYLQNSHLYMSEKWTTESNSVARAF